MSYLIVVAHPDDEVLGAGGSIYTWNQMGKEINICILSSQAQARSLRPGDFELGEDIKKTSIFLGFRRVFCGDFPNIKLNTVPHLELVQFIENAIRETNAEVIITHHPSDLNNDHVHTSLACQTAARLFQRCSDITPLKELLFMEVSSSTEWALNSSSRLFSPNTFVEIGKKGLDKKIEALSLYRDVMRCYPHPRSREGIEGLAVYRGGQSGVYYAEAFESVYRRIKNESIL